MKKKIAILLTILVLVTQLAGCASGGKTAVSQSNAYPADMAAGEAGYDGGGYSGGGTSSEAEKPPASTPMPSEAPVYDEISEDMSAGNAAQSIALPIVPQGGNGLAEKIIYSVYAEIESVDFDVSVDAVYAMLDKYGAFIENSYVGGRNYAQAYYGYQTYRSARFVIRVPKERLMEAAEGLSALGNVTSLQSDAQNITAQFTDTQARLETYKTQESRLLDMLRRAETVTDMIEIEARLSEVRYQIESMTSTLNNWQNQVDYSTMTIYINEVEKLSEITTVQRSYWMQIGDGTKATMRGIGGFFKDLFKWIAVNSPVLAILAVIAVVTMIIVRKKVRKKAKQPDDEQT